MTPTPDLLNIAKTAKVLYNTCSWLDEILRNETFPLLTIPTLDASELTIGTKALKTAYAERLNVVQDGTEKALTRSIHTAIEEKSRYMAERIART